MDIEVNVQEVKSGVFNVSAKGRIDSDTYSDFEQQVNDGLGEKAKNVIFDMSGVNYISSAGLGVIFGLMKTLKERKGELVLCRLQPQIKKVFEIVKALPLECIFSEEADADAYLERMMAEELKKPSDDN